jgi:hypothetical protein
VHIALELRSLLTGTILLFYMGIMTNGAIHKPLDYWQPGSV